MTNSRKKGNSYELKLAKIFNEWDPKHNYRRTPLSGGWDKEKAPGDIITPEWFPLVLEAKKREGWALEQLLKSPEKCPVLKWFRDEADKQGHSRILMIFSKNRDIDYFLMTGFEYGKLTELFGEPRDDRIRVQLPKLCEDYVIGKFEDWIDWIDAEGWAELCQ